MTDMISLADLKQMPTRLREMTSCCDPECEGRCRECPDILIRESADAIDHLLSRVCALEAALEEAAKVAEGYADSAARLLGNEAARAIQAAQGIAAHIRALKAQPAATGWRPIETAPRDRSFWGWHEKWGDPDICRWDGHSFKPETIIERLERTGFSGWYSPPSHWQPRWDVPTPPSQGSG